MLLTLAMFSVMFDLSARADKKDHMYSSLDFLSQSRSLGLQITAEGGHQGECVVLWLSNRSPDSAFIRIEPGRLLTSADTLAQDILITREELLALAPGERRSLRLFGFCAEASMASPDSASTFLAGPMADSTVVVLAEFLNSKGNAFPEETMQSAVWCLTDAHDTSGIEGEGTDELRTLVAGLQKIKYPGYGMQMQQEPYIQELRTTISGEVQIYFPDDCLVDIFICDRDGKVWESFEQQERYEAGAFEYSFRFTAVNWPEGTYFLRVMTDGKLLYQKEFDI